MADGVSRSLWHGDTWHELRTLALEEFVCFQISKGVDRFKLHVQVLKCGSNDVKKLQGLN